jgi:rare lipoprotein A
MLSTGMRRRNARHKGQAMARAFHRSLIAALAGLSVLSGCGEGGLPFLNKGSAEEAPAEGGPAAATIVEKDVEAPDVFAANEAGLWDGRPSLGGVWVAHPELADPERVLIRNEANGKEVVGAIFRRERDNPGPRIQVSSDAAEALGMLAGQPTVLDVVALRREEVEVPAEVSEGETVALGEAAGSDIESSALDSSASSDDGSIAAAEAAILAAQGEAPDEPVIEPAVEPAAAPAAPAPASEPSKLDKPYIQIGIFSVEQNAEETASSLRGIGVIPTVRAQESSGKPFWRVLVGPASTESDRRAILAKVRDLGFEDAYYVTN